MTPSYLMWWEHEELLEHLMSRPDIWSESDSRPGLWLRTDSDGQPGVGLLLVSPVKPGPYRRYLVKTVPMSWSSEQCDAYINDLLRHWTSYPLRIDVAAFLVTEVNMDATLAQNVAIAIARIGQVTPADPEQDPPLTQGRLTDSCSGFAERPFGERQTRYYNLTGGGYVSLSPRAGMLSITLSVPSRGRNFTGNTDFTGFVRPRNGNFQGALDDLFGVPEGNPTTPNLSTKESGEEDE